MFGVYENYIGGGAQECDSVRGSREGGLQCEGHTVLLTQHYQADYPQVFIIRYIIIYTETYYNISLYFLPFRKQYQYIWVENNTFKWCDDDENTSYNMLSMLSVAPFQS